MNEKATAVRRNYPNCRATQRGTTIKVRQPNRAVSRVAPWRPAPGNPRRCSPRRAQPRPSICKLNRPFPPIFLGSDGPVCGRRGCFVLRFDDVRVAQTITRTGSGFLINPIYVLFCSCHLLEQSLKDGESSLIGISHLVSGPRPAWTLFCNFGHFRPAS